MSVKEKTWTIKDISSMHGPNELIKDNYTIINTDINIAKLKKGKLKGHAKAWSDVSFFDKK